MLWLVIIVLWVFAIIASASRGFMSEEDYHEVQKEHPDRRIDNAVAELRRITGRLETRLEQHDQLLARHDSTLNTMDGTLARLDTTLATQTATLQALRDRL